MLLALLAQAAGSISPAPPPASPKALFSYEDYPEEAVRNRWQGKVVAELTIGRDGLPIGCRVVKSSGHKALDDATCNILRRRAKFVPAKDRNGNPTVDVYRTPPIEWRIQQ